MIDVIDGRVHALLLLLNFFLHKLLLSRCYSDTLRIHMDLTLELTSRWISIVETNSLNPWMQPCTEDYSNTEILRYMPN
jgi:hypothetical protein